MDKRPVWYKRKDFWNAIKGICALGVFVSIGASIYDKKLNLIGLLFWAFALCVYVPMAWVMRNNR